jgi:thiamine biosynthesis lipoprotein
MHQTRREWLARAGCGLLALGAGLPRVAFGAPGALSIVAGRGFGTTWRVALGSGADRVAVKSCIDGIIAAVGRAISPFDASSELSCFNAARHTGWVAVSPIFEAVVSESVRIGAMTGGAFEPTVGPLVNRFGFGPIKNGVASVYSDISVQAGMIRKARGDVTLDPCGIAKGYALDLIADGLGRLGHTDFLVQFGGEIAAQGAHPDGRPWHVGIERPVPGATLIQRRIRLDGKRLATSGDLINSFDVAGRRYCHIVDPGTAMPVNNPIASVSVLAPTGMEADALATALMVMGPERGSQFAERHHLPALFLLREAGGIRELMAADFAHHLLA